MTRTHMRLSYQDLLQVTSQLLRAFVDCLRRIYAIIDTWITVEWYSTDIQNRFER